MPKYNVRLIGFKKFRFPSSINVRVEAENVSEAKIKALMACCNKDGYAWYTDNVQEEGNGIQSNNHRR